MGLYLVNLCLGPRASVVNLINIHEEQLTQMGNEPVIGRETLIKAVQQSYSFEIVDFEYLLQGWGGDCFVTTTRDGTPYFLKLHDQEKNAVFVASSRPFYLPLMDQLHRKGILPDIPHPVHTRRGDLSLRIGPCELVVTNFIAGDLVGFGEIADPILAVLADRVGILHNSSAELAFEHPFIEGFGIVFESYLLKMMGELENVAPPDRPGQKLLFEAMRAHKDEILAHLSRLKGLQGYAKQVDKPMVICHTDLHGGNLMIDGQGTLYILDWENAMIAPPEHDMYFFAGEESFWRLFWPIYRRRYPQVDLDSKVLAFYFYRRGLEDIADYVYRIMLGDGSPERDRSDVEELLICLSGLAEVQKTVAEFEERFHLT